MRKAVLALLCLSLLSQAASTQKNADREAVLRSLVEAERAFASLSEARGIKESFVANLADDGILFRPGPVAGKKWMEEHPAPAGVLSWRPDFADVARSGELGYTAGPWEFREKSLEDKPVAHGQFVTIWKKQPDGAWKVAVDLGISHPPPRTAATEVAHPADGGGGGKPDAKTDAAAERSALIRMENEFSKQVAAGQTADALLSRAAADVRVYRADAFPAVGREAARALLAKKPGVLTWRPADGGVSRSGELGYTYGAYEFRAGGGQAAESGNYLRVWKRRAGGRWEIVLDISYPVAPPAPASQ